MSHPALLVVDVQKDFCPGGALAVPDGDRIVPTINAVAARFGSAALPVYATRDWHPPDSTHFDSGGGSWPRHCVAGTAGADFHASLHLPPDTHVISKGKRRDEDGYSAFEGTTSDGQPLGEHLQAHRVDKLIVGGLATDHCVRATVLDARAAGLEVEVLTDAVAGLDEEAETEALEEMRQAGATLVTTADVDLGD